jgi:SAM-dependent methyltransferase
VVDTPLTVTRGSGLLENVLAHFRAKTANDLISPENRNGRILDVGCGSFPYFLAHTSFIEKYAIDQNTPSIDRDDIHWHVLDLNSQPCLPFSDQYFEVVTFLAVVEHLDPNSLTQLFQEVYRTLQPGGKLILTTPAAWSDGLLHWMARINLVSHQEIDEHVYAYTLPLLGWYFGRAGFSMQKVHFGYFECWMNMWATAEK